MLGRIIYFLNRTDSIINRNDPPIITILYVQIESVDYHYRGCIALLSDEQGTNMHRFEIRVHNVIEPHFISDAIKLILLLVCGLKRPLTNFM